MVHSRNLICCRSKNIRKRSHDEGLRTKIQLGVGPEKQAPEMGALQGNVPLEIFKSRSSGLLTLD